MRTDFYRIVITSLPSILLPMLFSSFLFGCGAESNGPEGSSRNQVSSEGSRLNETQALIPCKNLKESLIEYNLEEHVNELTIMAEAGEPCAQYGLGSLYRLGYGVINPNSALAERYLTMAAAQGFKSAQYELDQLRL